MLKRMSDKMTEYSVQNNIKKQHPNGSTHINVLKPFMSDPEGWIERYYIVSETERADFFRFAKSAIASERVCIDRIDVLSRKIFKEMKSSTKKMTNAIQWIVKNYGDRLDDDAQIEAILNNQKILERNVLNNKTKIEEIVDMLREASDDF